MHVGQVEFSVMADGLDTVTARMKQLEGMANSLSGKRLKIRADAQIKDVEARLRQLQNMKFNYKMNFFNALNQLNKVQPKLNRMVDSIQRIQEMPRSEVFRKPLSAFAKSLSNVRAYPSFLGKIYTKGAKQYAKLQKDLSTKGTTTMRTFNNITSALRKNGVAVRHTSESWSRYYAKAHSALPKMTTLAGQYSAEVRKLQKVADWNKYEKDIGYMNRLAEGYRVVHRELKSFSKAGAEQQRAIENRTSSIARLGSRLQSFGNAVQNMTSPFMNVYRGLTMGLGYQALGKVMEGITGSFERYDTMRTYDKVLNQLGMNASKKFRVGTDRARTAVDNLEQSVLGLPTGLDEMVASMRRYAGATGNVEKATKLAIAANNSYIAGQMDSRAQLFTERQLLALAGGAELAATQWDSLRRNAPMAIRAVADALNMNVQDMITKLKSGEISGQKFLDVFTNVGTQGKIKNAAQKMKMTWGAVSQNISNAFHRMGSNVLETLDDVFKKTTGRDFLQTVLGVDKNGNAVGGGIKNFIDDISQSIQDFIKANPTAITDFFNDFKSIDWKGMMKGYADFARGFAKVFTWLGKTIGGDKFIKAMLLGNIGGKIFSAAGGLIRGLAGPLARLSLLGGTGFLTKIGNFFAKLTGFGKFALGADAAKNLANMAKAGEAAQAVPISWQNVASKAVTVAAIPAIAWSFKEAASALKELDGIKFNADMAGNITAIVTSMTTMVAGAATIGTLLSGSKLAMFGTGVASAAFLAIGKAFELFGKGVKSISESVKIASETEIPSEEHINDIIWAVGKIAKAFDAKNFGSIQKWVDSKSLQSQMEAIEQVADAFESIRTLGKVKVGEGVLKKAKKNFEDISTFANDIGNFFNSLESKEMGYSTIGQGGRFSDMNGEGKKKTPWATFKNQIRDFGETMTNMANGLAQMPIIMRNARKILTVHKNLTRYGGDTPLDWGAVERTIGSIADGLYGLLDREEGSVWDKVTKVANQLKNGNLTQISDFFAKLPGLMRNMWGAFRILDNNPLFGEKQKMPKKVKMDTMSILGATPKIAPATPLQTLENKVGEVIDAIARINEKFEGLDTAKFAGNMESMNTAFKFLRFAMNKLTKLNTEGFGQAKDLKMTNFESIGTKLGNVMEKLLGGKEGTKGLGETNMKTFVNKATRLNTAMKKINTALTEISKMSFGGGAFSNVLGKGGVMNRLRNVINRWNKLKSPKKKRFKFNAVSSVNLDNASSKIQTRWNRVINTWNKIQSKSKTVSFTIQAVLNTASVDAAIAEMSRISGRIQAALNSIKSYYSKTITVSINTVTQRNGKVRPGNGDPYDSPTNDTGVHTGGYISGAGKKPIYRAMGGFAYMMPKGTDTVPAMLTPGEYVVRKKAVDTYGARFFQALNHMDLSRALNSISVRAGQMVTPQASTTINNTRTTTNNDNSRTTHNTNVTVNGLGMASRFVNALQ